MTNRLPLLALPGLLNDERLWRHQAEALAADRAVTVMPVTAHDSLAALAKAALALAPHRFALAGFSMGGYVAFEILRQAPERVAALALVDTSARPDTPESSQMRRGLIAQSGSDFEGAMNAFLPRLVHASRLQDQPLIDVLAAMARAVGREGFVRQQTAVMARPDSRPMLARIAVPTLVLCGREDAITPLALSDEMAAGIAGARQVVIDGCGHAAPLEQPERVTQAMREWLADVA